MNEVVNVVNNHKCIRKFKDQEVPEEILDAIIAGVQRMPNSINAQHTSIIVVRDQAKKERLAELVGNQPYVKDSPVFLVFVMDFYKTYLAGEKVGNKQIIHESLEGILAGTFDGGIQLGAAVILAESFGLGTVPIGGIRKNPEEVIKLLGLPEYTFPLNGLVIGYPDADPDKKSRMPMPGFRHENTYDKTKINPSIDAYDEQMDTYLKSIGRKDIEVDYSTNTSKLYKIVYYPKVKGVLEKQGFKMDK